MLSTDNENDSAFNAYKVTTNQSLDELSQQSPSKNQEQKKSSKKKRSKKKRKNKKEGSKNQNQKKQEKKISPPKQKNQSQITKTEVINPEVKIESTKKKELEVTLVIPSKQAGQFIGKKGETINTFRKKTGANVQLQDRIVTFTDNREVNRLIKLKGDEAALADVIDRIAIKMNTTTQNREAQRVTLLCPNENITEMITQLKNVSLTNYKMFTFINVNGNSAEVADTCVDILVAGLGNIAINEKLIKTGQPKLTNNYPIMQSTRRQYSTRGGMHPQQQRNFFQQQNRFNNNNNNRGGMGRNQMAPSFVQRNNQQQMMMQGGRRQQPHQQQMMFQNQQQQQMLLAAQQQQLQAQQQKQLQAQQQAAALLALQTQQQQQQQMAAAMNPLSVLGKLDPMTILQLLAQIQDKPSSSSSSRNSSSRKKRRKKDRSERDNSGNDSHSHRYENNNQNNQGVDPNRNSQYQNQDNFSTRKRRYDDNRS